MAEQHWIEVGELWFQRDTGLGQLLGLSQDRRSRTPQAVAILAYYTPTNNPILFNEAQSWLDLVMSDPAV